MTKKSKQAPKLRVWWIPQVPMLPFRAEVKTLREAKLLLKVLANYDYFQFRNNIKPDYSNAGGLQVFDTESNNWLDWESEDGLSIDEVNEDGKPLEEEQ